MQDHRHQASIEVAKHRIEQMLYQRATEVGLAIDALTWTAPSATTPSRGRRAYQLDFTVHGWRERHSILQPERLMAAGAQAEDAQYALTEALAAIMASLRQTRAP